MKVIVAVFVISLFALQTARAQEYQESILLDAVDYEEISFQGKRFDRYEVLTKRGAGANELERISLTRPIIENEDQMVSYLLTRGRSILEVKKQIQSGHLTLGSVFTKVPGVPDLSRYEFERFKDLDSKITIGCRKNQQNFSALAANSLVNGEQLSLNRGQLNNLSLSYDQECLSPLNIAPKKMLRVTGYFYANSQAFCSGTIIGENTILTARHCLINNDGSNDDAMSHLLKGALTFRTLEKHNDEDSFAVQLLPDQDMSFLNSPITTNSDYIVLQTDETFEFGAGLELAPNGIDDYPKDVYLIGLNKNIHNADLVADPRFLMRTATPEKACAIIEKTEKGCFYHTCQTSDSTSGAGLLGYDASGKIILFGVHTGGVSTASGCEDSVPLDGKINVAYALNDI